MLGYHDSHAVASSPKHDIVITDYIHQQMPGSKRAGQISHQEQTGVSGGANESCTGLKPPLMCGRVFFLLGCSKVNVPKVQQTPRKGMVNVVNERFKAACGRRDTGNTLKYR